MPSSDMVSSSAVVSNYSSSSSPPSSASALSSHLALNSPSVTASTPPFSPPSSTKKRKHPDPPSLDDDAPAVAIVKSRAPALGCGEVKIVWNSRIQHDLHAYPLAKQLGLIRSMPDKPDTWPPFQIPATMASNEQLDAFIDIVYGKVRIADWVAAAKVDDLLGVMRLCSCFQYNWLESQCVEQLAEHFAQKKSSEADDELMALWRFLSGIKNARLRAVALSATADCLKHDYGAARATMSAARVWSGMDKGDMEHMLKRACEKKKKVASKKKKAATKKARK